LGVGQRLDRRPQLIDQRIAIADFASLFDIGQSVPQRQQLLAAEPGRMQFLTRSDGDFAFTHCGRGFAAQGDSVIANDVNAHGWFS
jgi:hypothetical protein